MPHADEVAPRLREALKHAPDRPLVLLGRSGSGKTTVLGHVLGRSDRQAVWSTARDLVDQMIEAMRDDRYPSYRDAVARDERPLCVEHSEDLRGKAATRGEVRRLLADRAARGQTTILTVTRARGDSEVIEWLASWTEILVLE